MCSSNNLVYCLVFGSLATGNCCDSRRLERRCQSITTERQFNDFWGILRSGETRNTQVCSYPTLKKKSWHRSQHGNLHLRNILVYGGRVSGIIDWETGGWYPEYWGFMKGLNAGFKGSKDWSDYLRRVTRDYAFEWSIDMHLDRLIKK